jgi:hypothetical protein
MFKSNGMLHRCCFSPEYNMRKEQVYQEERNLNWSQQRQVNTDVVNLFGGNLDVNKRQKL